MDAPQGDRSDRLIDPFGPQPAKRPSAFVEWAGIEAALEGTSARNQFSQTGRLPRGAKLWTCQTLSDHMLV
jgi:hypothetical protein